LLAALLGSELASKSAPDPFRDAVWQHGDAHVRVHVKDRVCLQDAARVLVPITAVHDPMLDGSHARRVDGDHHLPVLPAIPELDLDGVAGRPHGPVPRARDGPGGERVQVHVDVRGHATSADEGTNVSLSGYLRLYHCIMCGCTSAAASLSHPEF